MDLKSELLHLTFDPTQITYLLDEGPEQTYRRQYLENLVLHDAEFAPLRDPPQGEVSREEAIQRASAKMNYMAKRVKDWNLLNSTDINYVQRVVFPHELGTAELLTYNFVQTLRLTATEEQFQKWSPRVRAFQVVPYFAQTELGHGTHVRGLETTAQYDTERKEFVLNTPTLTSIKWWCTTVGDLCRWAVIVARLISAGRDYGQGHFFVPLFENAEAHQGALAPTKGLTTGDIGPCLGLPGISFRYIQLKNVKIPRENLLSRLIDIADDGRITHLSDSHISTYIGIVIGRTQLCNVAARTLGHAVTMATRYNCNPRSNLADPRMSLDNVTQQHKLLPLLAKTYAYWFTGIRLRRRMEAVSQQISTGRDATEALRHLHGLAAGLKAYVTSETAAAVKTCRQTCSGSENISVAFHKIYSSFSSLVTADGEETVMYLQTARYLLRYYDEEQLSKKDTPVNSLGTSDPEQDEFLGHLTSILKTTFSKHLQAEKDRMRKGASLHWMLPERAVPLVTLAKTFASIETLSIFEEEVIKTLTCIRRPLYLLCCLYGVTLALKEAGNCLQVGLLSGDDVDRLKELQLSLCRCIRSVALALTDAFDLCDRC